MTPVWPVAAPVTPVVAPAAPLAAPVWPAAPPAAPVWPVAAPPREDHPVGFAATPPKEGNTQPVGFAATPPSEGNTQPAGFAATPPRVGTTQYFAPFVVPAAPAPQPMYQMAPYAPAPPVRQKSKAPTIVVSVIVVIAVAAAAFWFFWFRDNVPGTPGNTNNPTPGQGNGAGVQTATRLTLPGSCFDLAQTEASTPAYGYAWVVPCTQPHDSEVFLNQTVTASTYPDDAGWADLASQYCNPAFKNYVGSDMNTSRLNVQYIRPTQQSWGAGNNALICFAVDPNGSRTTSVANTKE